MTTDVSEEIDFNDLAYGLQQLKDKVTSDHVATIYEVFEFLRRVPFPPGYLDQTRTEMFRALRERESTGDHTYVYLSFYGENERASHMKIGVAKNVKARMAGIKTGNPLPKLWTYSAWFSTKKEALIVESALLKHMAADAVHGEWVSVGALSEQAARSIVESLTEVAGAALNSFANFKLCEV